MDWKPATVKADGSVSIPKRWLHLHYYEALNILFRMENALRVFVYVVLKNEFKEKWTETALQVADDEQSTIAAAAAKREAQAKGFGYLGYEISSPLMYLNSGELTRIIFSDAYWELFKPFFRGRKEIIRTKLDEIGMVRNGLAHFRPLKYDDIELIKQNIKHAFVGIEECLAEMTQAYRIVPTNSTFEWYETLSKIVSDRCKIGLFQDSSEQWVRIGIHYTCAVLQHFGSTEYQSFQTTNLVSPAIIASHNKGIEVLLSHCTFVTEAVQYPTITSERPPELAKETSIVFRKDALEKHHSKIADELKKILDKIDTETELIEKDNLARGVLIESVRLWATLHKDEENRQWWTAATDALKCEFSENDPTEYWGGLGLYTSDFIAGSRKYPWMPSNISEQESPFE